MIKTINYRALRKTVVLHSTGREAQEEAQALVISEFLDQTIIPKYRLMVNYATGVGKAKAAIETAAAFYEKGFKSPMFIGCYTEKARDSVWRTEIAKWGRMHHAITNPTIECYASMHKIRGQRYSLVILDEAQHLTPLSYTFFQQNAFDGVLILTATEPRDRDKRYLIHQLTAGRRLIISPDEAIDAGILNDFEVYVMDITLDDTIKRRVFANSNTLYTDYTGYIRHCALVDHAKRSGDRTRIKFASIGRQRYIGTTMTKTLAASYIQTQFRSKQHRFLTFASSIEQANSLSTFVFHSKSNDDAYTAFLHNRIDELVSLKMIREAENFSNLGRALVIQLDSNPGNIIQIIGRTLRLPEDQMSRIYILCALNTMDEMWCRKALAQTNPDKIHHYPLDRELYWPIEPTQPIQPTLL